MSVVVELEPNPVALAVSLLRELLRALPSEEQRDLRELIPAMLGPDGDERESALAAVQEILLKPQLQIQPWHVHESDDTLQKWMQFVGVRVCEARARMGLTQVQLAEHAAVPLAYLENVESGLHSPSEKALTRIAEALSVSMADLIPPETAVTSLLRDGGELADA